MRQKNPLLEIQSRGPKEERVEVQGATLNLLKSATILYYRLLVNVIGALSAPGNFAIET